MRIRELGNNSVLLLALVLMVFMAFENWINDLATMLLSLRGPQLVIVALVLATALAIWLTWRLRRRWVRPRDFFGRFTAD